MQKTTLPGKTLTTHSTARTDQNSEVLHALRSGNESVWLRTGISGSDAVSPLVSPFEVREAADRFARFAPLLGRLFHSEGWDGRIKSPLLDGPEGSGWLIKGDHNLPVTGSIKARGGIHALLCIVEKIAQADDLPLERLTEAAGRALLSRHTVIVASTGNLGYSIGIFARAFGLAAEIHMSSDAKGWKKDRLRDIGARVVEHDCDYSETLDRARAAATCERAWLVDDERCRDLLTGYAVAGEELADQLAARRIVVDSSRPLIVYLPCGVGGAPGGITHGLKRRFGRDVVTVFVEPSASPCMLVALASGRGADVSVYDYGCDNDTIADGLAVPRASELVLEAVGDAIDAAVAVPDSAMIEWVGKAWRSVGIRLEPSAAAALAAFDPLRKALAENSAWPDLGNATHLFWATGGSRLPDSEFNALLERGQ